MKLGIPICKSAMGTLSLVTLWEETISDVYEEVGLEAVCDSLEVFFDRSPFPDREPYCVPTGQIDYGHSPGPRADSNFMRSD